MIAYDDPTFAELSDPRTGALIELLSRDIFGETNIVLVLKGAGLSPGDYPLTTAKVAWTQAVPDAARLGKLGDMITTVSKLKPAFQPELERKFEELMRPATVGGGWYRSTDPYTCSFVGLRSARAVIDRRQLRHGLRELAEDQYWVLVVHGHPRAGKTHTWLLIDHLRSAGKLVGINRFVRVTTHQWSGEVPGEAVAQSLAFKLGLSIDLAPSAELDDARVRKYLDRIVGEYPNDGVTRWIVLDGLDRPGVYEGARDFARGLIQLVEDRELPQTRLIVTGLDPLGLHLGYTVRTEEIPAIDRLLLRDFLNDVAQHLGQVTSEVELRQWVDEILGPGPEPRDLADIEADVVRLVTTRWAQVKDSDG